MTHALPILVTGAAGFIGARFVETCNQKGIPVVSVDYLDCFHKTNEHQGFDFGTRVAMEDLFKWLEDESPAFSAVVHMGACSSTTETRKDFLDQVNVEYSQRLWNYCTDNKIPFIYASSAATYGNGEIGYDDDESQFENLSPLNLYGESKRTFDLWAIQQEKEGRTPPSWAGFKFFNVYGFGEAHKGPQSSVVLQAYHQIKQKGEVTLFRSHKEGIADGHQARDFVAVEDVLSVLHFALEAPIQRGVYNLGTGKAQTFLELAQATFRALDCPEKLNWKDTPENIRNQYQYFTEANMTKLRNQGYDRPFLNLEDGVRIYVDRLEKLANQ